MPETTHAPDAATARVARLTASLHRRTRERLIVSSETWNGTPHVLWTGATVRGYGVVWDALRGNNARVHRVAWEMVNGPIPDDLTIDHLCRTPLCGAVDHMEPVTNVENARRADPGAWQRAKTHCPRGHEYNEANTRYHRGVSGRLGRQCRVCQRDNARAKAARLRTEAISS